METNCFRISQLDLLFSLFLTCAWFWYFEMLFSSLYHCTLFDSYILFIACFGSWFNYSSFIISLVMSFCNRWLLINVKNMVIQVNILILCNICVLYIYLIYNVEYSTNKVPLMGLNWNQCQEWCYITFRLIILAV